MPIIEYGGENHTPEEEAKRKEAGAKVDVLFKEALAILAKAEIIAKEAGILVEFPLDGIDGIYYNGSGDFWTSSQWCLGNG